MKSKVYIFSMLAAFAVAFGAKAQMTKETAAKTKFELKTVIVGGKKIEVEIADSPDKQMQGLMFRQHLDQDRGMLFIFDTEEPRSFWMKNTLIDLSIAYISKKKKIIDIQEMKATSVLEIDPPAYPSKAAAQYALEMPRNWFAKNKIKVGDTLQIK